MRFVTDDLQAKIDAGTATKSEQSVYRILAAVDTLSPDEAAQKILQAEFICDARSSGHADTADAVLELFLDDAAIVRRGEHGFEIMLTDKGMAMGAALVKRIARGDPN
jgi:hypothetical protein